MKRSDQFVVVFCGDSKIPTAINLDHVVSVSPAGADEIGIHKVGDGKVTKCRRENCRDLLIAVGLERAKVGKTAI